MLIVDDELEGCLVRHYLASELFFDQEDVDAVDIFAHWLAAGLARDGGGDGVGVDEARVVENTA